MANKKLKIAFQVGDRVAEKPKPVGISKKQYVLATQAGITTQRHGVVTDVVIKTNSCDKRRLVYVQVQWDHLNSPVTHLQNRLCKESDLTTKQNVYRNAI